MIFLALMCSGTSSRGSLLWYRWTSEKWHASMFRKPDMTAGYLVSLLHRCTIALGKKRHQSSSSARRQRRIISGKVFTASLRKKMEAMPRKSVFWEKPRRAFSAKKVLCRGLLLCGEPGPPRPIDWASRVIPSALQQSAGLGNLILIPLSSA